MSYMRPLCPYEYVKEGHSEGDYIFENSKGIIEDYGEVKNETIIDILLSKAETTEDILLKQMMVRLAENLNIKLRKNPLTFKEFDKLHRKIHKEEGWGSEKLKTELEKLKNNGNS